MSVSEEYDDNVNLSADNKEHDWITFLTPGLTLSLITEETEANLIYDFSFVKYARNDERSTVRHGLTLSGFQGIPVSERVTLDLDASLRISEDPFEIDEVEVDVTRPDRGRYYSSILGGRANYFFGPEDSVYVGFTHRMLLNEEPGFEDRREYLPSAGLNYWFSTQHGFGLAYSYSNAEYDVSEDYQNHLGKPSYIYRYSARTEGNISYAYDDLRYEGIRPGYAVHTVTVGVSHQFSSSTLGSLTGGYFIVVPEEGENRGDFTGSISLTHTSPRSTFVLDGATGYRRRFFQTENLGLSFFGRASVIFTYQLLERLSTSLTGSYYRDDFQETVEERVDTNWRGSVALDYRILRWLYGQLRYQYRQRETNIDLDEYVDNRVMLTFGAVYSGKPRPL